MEITPSISTSRLGTFLRTSDPEPPADARFLPTVKICLSIV
jgi:hypothetical protein